MVQSKLVQKKKNFEKAVKTLQAVLIRMQQMPRDDEDFIFFRDSLIQRFEYCTDMFWKLLKDFIAEKHGVEVLASPKAVLKQAVDLHIINDEQYKLLLQAVNDRNLSSHAYHEDVAEEISGHVQAYYLLMQNVSETFTA
jgi:nucleotidyltransferase substrate binding protein (TIGR01987 family)